MPFTVSHAAAVLPLKMFKSRWFSLTGLMAGAMSPDLIYFLTMQTEYRGVSHSWPGLIIFCLPAGIVFSFAFHHLVKRPLVDHLPWLLERRLSGAADQPFRVRSPRAWLVLVFSVLIGALSHFGWDSFTHVNGEVARLFPVLGKSFSLLGYTRPLCRYLQHFSTIAGGVALILFVFRNSILAPPTITQPRRSPGQKLAFWFIGGVVSTLFALLVVHCLDRLYDLNAAADYTQYAVVSGFGLAGWAGFFGFCCLFGLLPRSRHEGR